MKKIITPEPIITPTLEELPLPKDNTGKRLLTGFFILLGIAGAFAIIDLNKPAKKYEQK